ncbi:MAG: gamma-glutamyltransferase, partial [Acidobacteriaceae bacterium]
MAPQLKNIRPLRALAVSLLLTLPLAAQTPKPAQDATPGNASQTALLLQNDQPVRAPHAMVVTVHHLATDAGVGILQAGGNAVDAAVAVGFALAVVYPFAGNLGGGGFMLI